MSSWDGAETARPGGGRGRRWPWLWLLAIPLVALAGTAVWLYVGDDEGGDGDGPAAAAADFLEANGARAMRGQFGPMYDDLHPSQQALLTRDQFMSCWAVRVAESPVALSPDDVGFDVVDSYEEPVVIPGTETQVDTLAVTYELTAMGESLQQTSHVVEVDGSPRWMMTEQQLEECLNPIRTP